MGKPWTETTNDQFAPHSHPELVPLRVINLPSLLVFDPRHYYFFDSGFAMIFQKIRDSATNCA
jgi:hypothetical protein